MYMRRLPTRRGGHHIESEVSALLQLLTRVFSFLSRRPSLWNRCPRCLGRALALLNPLPLFPSYFPLSLFSCQDDTLSLSQHLA
jgi:hypothetical protein